VLIAQAIFLFSTDRLTDDRQTYMAVCPTHAGGYTANVGNEEQATAQ